MLNYYILDGHDAVPCDLYSLGAMMNDPKTQRVALTTIGESLVSTVFLGLDHSFGVGPPILFETMVFDGPLDQEQDRCTTWEQAEAMHAEMCKRVQLTQGVK